ncbi:MAG: HNH endonuclease, partial [Anaerolineales bacterium]|nr:HNH endonuclease [Anaerolineales bacterium]
MNYEEYMRSDAWRQKREKRLEIDGHCCRMCDHDGSLYRLEVHHRPSSYKRIPNESVEDDLTTLCVRCHDLATNAIRGDRYEK